MRELRFDLRSEQRRSRPAPGQRIMGFADLATMARNPRALASLLWRPRYDSFVSVEDELPKSGKQAGALLIGSLARARRRRVERPSGCDEFGWLRFLVRAVAALAIAAPREHWQSWRLRRRAASVVDTLFRLPRYPSGTNSVVYLRAEPTLLFRGSLSSGATTHTVGVVNALVANGVNTRVYAPHRPSGLDAPVTTVSPRRLFHFDPWLTLVDSSEAFVLATQGESADFVYQRYALGSYAGLEIARRLGVPLVLEYNGSEVWIIRHWGNGNAPVRGSRLKRRFERHTLREASLNVVPSEPLRDELISLGVPPERILVNPNGVDVGRLASLRERPAAEWRARHRLADAPTVGFIGTFGPWHGVQLLPEVVDRVGRQVPEARWVLVGDGLLFDKVRADVRARAIEDRVFLPGSVPRELGLELLAASDVCISPHVPNPDGSRFFGSPTKLFEYMGLGKPIVASDLEQIGEVLDHERTGVLCTPGSVEETAEAIIALLRDEPRRQRLGAAALEEVGEHYTWDAHVRRILETLDRG